MIPTYSGILPFLVVVAVLAALTAVASLALVAEAAQRHHRARVRRQETMRTYYRRLALSH